MKSALFFLCFSAQAAVPVLSGIVIDDYNVNGHHSGFRVTWSTDVAPDNQRIEWGPTSSYTRVQYSPGPTTNLTGQQYSLVGLVAGTDMDAGRVVHFRVGSHNASGWGVSADQTVTIPALPAIHPAPATLPASFTIPQPSEAGCTVQTVANDLSDFQSKLNTASANQPSACQVLVIPAGSAGQVQIFAPRASDVDSFTYNTGTNVLTNTGGINTYANGNRVRVAGDGFAAISLPTGLQAGADYCVSSVSGATFQLTAWPSCSGVVSLGTAGSGSPSVTPFPPPNSNYIIIRSNGTYPPDGTRIDPRWQTAANTARWKPNFAASSGVTNAFSYTNLVMVDTAHHYYLGPGLDLTAAPTNQTGTTDPAPWPTRVFFRQTNSYIAFQRNFITGLGYPERQTNPAFLDGSYVDFSNNYMVGMDFWHPVASGFAQTIASATVSVASGAYNTGIGNCPSVASSSVTLTSNTSGQMYYALTPATCALVAILPSGTTATCSGCSTAVGTGFAVNGNSQYTQGQITTCAFVAGAFTACDGLYINGLSVYGSGESQMISSFGPGPTRFANNYEECHGICWHIDDGGASNTLVLPTDITISRNYMNVLAKYRYGSSQNNGFDYHHRQIFECKRCSKVLIKGNYLTGTYKSQNDGPAILWEANASFCTAPCAGSIGDTTITSNWINGGSNGIGVASNFPHSYFLASYRTRTTITNNLITGIDSYNYVAKTQGYAPGNGYAFYVSFGGEDIIVDHNTVNGLAGNYPQAFQFVGQMTEGLSATNNIWYLGADNGRLGSTGDWGSSGTNVPSCSSLSGWSTFTCAANNVYGWSNNVLIPGYNNTQTNTGDSTASLWTASWVGTNTWIPTNSLVTDRVASIGWQGSGTSANALVQTSPYISGGADRATDNLDLGVDTAKLADDMGSVSNVRTLSITSSGFTAAFHKPDAGGTCTILGGTAALPQNWTTLAADSSAGQEMAVAITGLASKTLYNWTVACANAAITPTQTVTTK